MNNNTKHKYIPCEVKMVEFQVEKGFAQASSMTQGNDQHAWAMKLTGDGFARRGARGSGSNGSELEKMWTPQAPITNDDEAYF